MGRRRSWVVRERAAHCSPQCAGSKQPEPPLPASATTARERSRPRTADTPRPHTACRSVDRRSTARACWARTLRLSMPMAGDRGEIQSLPTSVRRAGEGRPRGLGRSRTRVDRGWGVGSLEVAEGVELAVGFFGSVEAGGGGGEAFAFGGSEVAVEAGEEAAGEGGVGGGEVVAFGGVEGEVVEVGGGGLEVVEELPAAGDQGARVAVEAVTGRGGKGRPRRVDSGGGGCGRRGRRRGRLRRSRGGSGRGRGGPRGRGCGVGRVWGDGRGGGRGALSS